MIDIGIPRVLYVFPRLFSRLTSHHLLLLLRLNKGGKQFFSYRTLWRMHVTPTLHALFLSHIKEKRPTRRLAFAHHFAGHARDVAFFHSRYPDID
jgi:hypothetical protein